MSKQSFQYLCDQLKGVLEKQTTRLRKPLAVEQHVANTVWILTTTSKYRTVAHLFGVARCTVCGGGPRKMQGYCHKIYEFVCFIPYW